MNPMLAAMLALLGVSRLDDETAALTEATEKVKALQADAAKYDEKVNADAKSALDKCMADLETEKGKNAALQAELDAMKKKDKDRKDAEDLAVLKTLAGKVNVKADGLSIDALRLAVAKTRVDSVDDKTPREHIDGILQVVAADAAKVEADTKWKFDSAKPEDKARADAEFADPYLDNIDNIHGGA